MNKRDLNSGDKVKFVYSGTIKTNYPLEKDKIYEVTDIDNSYTDCQLFYIKGIDRDYGRWCFDSKYFIKVEDQQQVSDKREKKWYSGY